MEEVMTVAEAAGAKDVSRQAIYLAAHRGSFPVLRVGRRHYIPRTEEFRIWKPMPGVDSAGEVSRPSGEWMGTQQVADMHGVTQQTIRCHCRLERLRSRRIGNAYVIARADAERFRRDPRGRSKGG